MQAANDSLKRFTLNIVFEDTNFQKNKVIQSRWLPLALALGLIFIPSSFMFIKLFGVFLALILFYRSILLDKDISKRSLIK